MIRCATYVLAAATAFGQAVTPTNPADREQSSTMAGRILESTQRARGALAKKDKDEALRFVNEALQNATAIEIARPHAPQPLMVTLYKEIIQISVNQPVQPDGQPMPASQANSANRSANDQMVTNAEGQATRVSLNVTQAKQHLEAAKNALHSGDPAAADGALAAVEKDVTAQTVAEDLPLLKARQNLGLALNQVRQQHYNEAAAPLSQAAAALGEYSGSKARHASDAGRLKGQIDGLAAAIAQDHKDAEKKISGWWNEVSGWFTPLEAPSTTPQQK